jgi:RNase P protein component
VTPTPDNSDVSLLGCSDEELRRRLDSLTREYDGFVRVVASTTLKAAHVREEISRLIEEFERRNRGR